jgi:branched-chain amino acid transport system permease protein
MTSRIALKHNWPRLSELRTPVLPLSLAAAAFLAPLLGLNAFWQNQIALTGIYGLIVVGLNLSFGFAGELALGQVALFAVGAYVTGYAATHGLNDLLLTLVLSAAAAGVIGIVSGIPGLRVGGWALAMLSFFLVILIPDVTQMTQSITGGAAGLTDIPVPKLFGIALSTTGFYEAIVVVVLIWFAGFRRFVLSRHAGALRTLRESPVLAGTVGISVYRTKLFAYVLGGLPAGLAGCLFAYQQTYVGPDSFPFSTAVGIIAASIIGGRRSIYGALVGAGLYETVTIRAAAFAQYSLIIYGLSLLIVGVLFSEGLADIGRRTLAFIDQARGTGEAVSVDRPLYERAALDVRTEGDRSGKSRPETREFPGAEILGQRLRIEDVSISFGGLRALDQVTLEIAPGQIGALIGTNGSGKTTLLNIISGLYRQDSGRVMLDEHLLDQRRPFAVARAGVGRTFQVPIIPTDMTAREVIATGRFIEDYHGVVSTVLRLPSAKLAERRDLEVAEEMLGFLGLSSSMGSKQACLFPLAQRRLIELARALVLKPKILLLDEPASGLDEEEVGLLGRAISSIRELGATVLLVEHNMAFVKELADVVYVLDSGRVLTSGSPESVARHEAVAESFFG